MDNDYPFVCFSDYASEMAFGPVPFADGTEGFAANFNEKSFYRFFVWRCIWHWYPIVTSGFTSGPVHGDLNQLLDDERRLVAIGYAAAICAREDGKRFISALGLLSLLCRSIEEPKEVPELTTAFMRIRENVTRNAVDPNIPFWFSKVALFQLATEAVPEGFSGTFDRASLNAPEKGWDGYGLSLDFPQVDGEGPQHCPRAKTLLRERMAQIKGGAFVLEYQRSAMHQGCKYWIWLYRNTEERPTYHWYLYVVVPPRGKARLYSHALFGAVDISPEMLVARHAFDASQTCTKKEMTQYRSDRHEAYMREAMRRFAQRFPQAPPLNGKSES